MNIQTTNLENTGKPDLRILRLKQVIVTIGLSRSTIYELMNPKSKYYDSTFPQSIHLSQDRVGWLAHEVDNWLISKIAQRNASASLSMPQPAG